MEGEDLKKVTRINLKTHCSDRKALIDYCLHRKGEQKLAIGWSYLHEENGHSRSFVSYRDFYKAVRARVKRINHALNVFWYAKEGDLFWTRDLDGNYWICRAKGEAVPEYHREMDIGAVVPVEAHEVGMTVPGQISTSFNRLHGGICQDIYDNIIVEYSKHIFNEKTQRKDYTYPVHKVKENLLENLPPFELEELVISYIQIKEGYYVLSNSIARGSTTVKVECEFRSRNPEEPKKAVVQVKGGAELDASEFQDYAEKGYIVYLYASKIENLDKIKNCFEITGKELKDFYDEYKEVLPESIKELENLFRKHD